MNDDIKYLIVVSQKIESYLVTDWKIIQLFLFNDVIRFFYNAHNEKIENPCR